MTPPIAAFATRFAWLPHLPPQLRAHLPPLPQSISRRLSVFPDPSYTDSTTTLSDDASRSSFSFRRFSLFAQKYSPLPTTTFFDDAAAGLHSSNFDLSGNIEAGDARSGLDAQGKKEVLAVMRKRGVGFDEARRLLMEDKFRKAGVGLDGRPLDPKAVTFS